jgi:hypothetical protein
VGPQEALAMVSSSSSWLPDPEPPPSPDASALRRPPGVDRIAGDAGLATGSERVKRYWIVGGTLGGVIVVLMLMIFTMLNRPATSHAQSAKQEEGQEGAAVARATVIPAASIEEPSQPAPAATPRVVNLLKLVDPRKDTFTGNWKLQNAEESPLVSSDATQHARLNIPYQPPEEYDFRVDFVRQGGDNCMAQMFTHGKPCALILYGWKGKVSGFQLVKDHFADKNETGVHDLPTANGQHHTSIVRVRRHYIEAWLDGTLIIHYDTEGNDLGSKDWAIDTPLGVGSQTSPTLFQVIELTEVTGRGHRLR